MHQNHKLGIWCEGLDRIYVIKPIIRELISRNVDFTIYYPQRQHHELIASFLAIAPSQVRDTTCDRPIKSKILGHLTLLFIGSVMSLSFSNMLRRRIASLPFVYRSLRYITPSLKKNANYVYTRLIKSVVSSVVLEDTILSVSLVQQPYWLAAHAGRLFCYIESWDHAVKAPILHSPNKIYYWHENVQQDFISVQGDIDGSLVYPFRFRYIDKYRTLKLEDEELFESIITPQIKQQVSKFIGRGLLTYACTTSLANKYVFAEEVKFMKDLAQFGQDEGIFVYFKPKPGGRNGELSFLEEFPNVVLGLSGSGTGEQMLSNDYHIYRYLLLKNTQLFVNLGTTFSLEAAIMGCPIFQISPSDTHPSDHLKDYSNNPHLKKYFYSNENCFIFSGEFADISSQLLASYMGTIDKPVSFSRYLRAWLESSFVSQDASLKLIVDDLLC